MLSMAESQKYSILSRHKMLFRHHPLHIGCGGSQINHLHL
jgi:hypothetical protein